MHLQLDVLGVIEELEQIVQLVFHIVVVHQRCHSDVVLLQSLLVRVLHHLVMSVQHVINVNFLNNIQCHAILLFLLTL